MEQLLLEGLKFRFISCLKIYRWCSTFSRMADQGLDYDLNLNDQTQ